MTQQYIDCPIPTPIMTKLRASFGQYLQKENPLQDPIYRNWTYFF